MGICDPRANDNAVLVGIAITPKRAKLPRDAHPYKGGDGKGEVRASELFVLSGAENFPRWRSPIMRRALAPCGVRMTGPRLPIAARRTARDSSRESAPLAKWVSSNAPTIAPPASAAPSMVVMASMTIPPKLEEILYLAAQPLNTVRFSRGRCKRTGQYNKITSVGGCPVRFKGAADEVLRRETGYHTDPLGVDFAPAARIPLRVIGALSWLR
jgi:hypothetical protein